MVFLLFLVLTVSALDALCDAVAAIVRRMNRPRVRWNRGGRFIFN